MRQFIQSLERRRLLSAARFAVIGDFGFAGQPAASVANLIHGWNDASPLDAVITTGDNNYDTGEWSTIDSNIGRYYSRYIGNYVGGFTPGATSNKFFPSPGNHDWASTVDHDKDGVRGLDPYLDYFTLPQGTSGNERYYDFVIGPVHFVVVDSDPAEPHGRSANSTQGQWVQQRLAQSTSPWQVVYFHHAAYSSSSNHGSDPTMQWPFAQWGADVILTGHDHLYERLQVDGIPYIVNGSGGRSLYGFATPIPQSQFRYNADYGAQLVDATDTELRLKFYNSGHLQPSTLIDELVISKSPPTTTTATFQEGLNGYLGSSDTFVQQALPGTAFAGDPSIVVDSDEPAGTNQDSQGLLVFRDIFGSNPGQIPVGSEIVAARLDVNIFNTGGQVNLHRMLGEWNSTATWNSLGNGIQSDNVEAASAVDTLIPAGSGGTYGINVTSALQAWAQNPASNFGWVLLPTTNDGVDFYSGQGTTPPRLVVQYNPAADRPLVSVAASDGTASEFGDSGEFTFSRSGDPSNAVTVSYSLGGTATNGVDYTSLSGTIVIPAGQASITLPIAPIDDSVYEGNEAVQVTVLSTLDYTAGSPSAAVITITDNDPPPPIVTIVASDASASETGDPGQFTITRTGDISSDLVVGYSLDGTASSADYEPLSGSVTILAGQMSATFSVVAINDMLVESNETLIATLLDADGYDLGNSASAIVTITSEDALPPPPIAPSDLTATPISTTAIRVNWIDNSSNEDGFVIEYSPDNGKTWRSGGTVLGDVTTFTVSGLNANKNYQFRVYAFDDLTGTSSYSNIAVARTLRK